MLEVRVNQPQEAACKGCGGGGWCRSRGNARRMPRHDSICTHDRASVNERLREYGCSVDAAALLQKMEKWCIILVKGGENYE